MSKKQFTLDSWLKDKSQKVVTRCGFPVRIVCTDVKRKDYPILALVERDDQEEYQSFTKDGRFSLYNPLHDNFDLFIETADEVSEDEKILEIIKHCIESRYLHTSTIKGISQKQCLAWLEKQGHEPKWCHHKVDLSNCSEEYRKAYYDGWNNCNMQHSQCESEKSDVLKCLINGMKFYYEDNEEATWGTQKFSMKVKDILSWLEKQGDYANFRDKAQVGDRITKNEDGVLVNLSQLKRVAKPSEKQGEQKFEMKTAEESLGIDSNTYNKIVDECLFGEQKPADKVEPKFKVGNWYQCTKDFFGKGVTFDKNTTYYCAKEGCLQNEYGCHIAIVKDLYDNFKLWTIQDAKDGDVLADYAGVILFRKIGNERYADVVDYYCVVNTGGRFEIQEKFEYWGEVNDAQLHPATKEQRDTLLKAMADAGYTFDFEKKELKKIAEEPQLKEGNFYECIKSYHYLGGGQYWFDKGKVYFCERDGYLRSDPNNNIYVYDCENWQNYFRPYTKKTAEWSEEDEINVYNIIHFLEEPSMLENNEPCKKIVIDWLKSLRPQNTYNPYKAVVESIAEMCKHYDKASHSGLRDFYDNVKVKCKDAQEYDKMFPQAQWKPSELQLGCLSDAIEHYNSLGYPASKLKELYEQLKKLKEGKV